MPQLGSMMRRGLVLAAAALLLASCGRNAEREAELSAAPVHRVVAMLSQHPGWKQGRCLCVGQFTGDSVEDFPAGLLAAEFARHNWVRNWSECAPNYGRLKGIAQCRAGMTDYVCSVADKADLPSGTTRVECHINAKNELLFDEYDVSRGDGGLVVHPVSLKASERLKTVEKADD
jgi:hypothetical protein